MDRSPLPRDAFVDPSGANSEAIRELTEEVFDRLLTQLSTAAHRSPLPDDQETPSAQIPETPQPLDVLLEKLEDIVDGSMNPAHPGYVGHMDTTPTTVSVLGDLVTSAVNNNMLSVEMSPVFSELEAQVTRTIATEFGLGADAGGVLTSGGSLANIHALAVARNKAFDVQQEGLTGFDREPVIFASEVSHTSLQKAAMLLGLGTDAIVAVETDENSRLDPVALERAITRAEGEGRAPFCVVATAGTTTTGNIDPLPEIRDVAREHGLWFHVDAAYGGALVFSENERGRLRGIEAADSITFNPQKWCYVAKTCAMSLFADRADLQQHFRIGAPYMRGDDVLPNLGEVSVQGTRRADVLKLWLTFQHLGRTGLEQLIDESYRLGNRLRDRVADNDALELATEPETNIVCFRVVPEWCPQGERDELNSRVQQQLHREYDVFVSLPTYRDSRWLRVVPLNPFTNEATIDRLLDSVEDVLEAERP
ncbi:pyridoxal phosphate-dependent decarboxylase family protein [Haloferax sp. S1W]|uniref:pyridoxal phosphate-dependent decarboxylase family protein n=1 Tax=Haloferax sp. S1W TaxID=3377110 RepID=UPI0037CAF938